MLCGIRASVTIGITHFEILHKDTCSLVIRITVPSTLAITISAIETGKQRHHPGPALMPQCLHWRGMQSVSYMLYLILYYILEAKAPPHSQPPC